MEGACSSNLLCPRGLCLSTKCIQEEEEEEVIEREKKDCEILFMCLSKTSEQISVNDDLRKVKVEKICI